MFANVRDEYVFKMIDPALVPEEKFKPKRINLYFRCVTWWNVKYNVCLIRYYINKYLI